MTISQMLFVMKIGNSEGRTWLGKKELTQEVLSFRPWLGTTQKAAEDFVSYQPNLIQHPESARFRIKCKELKDE